MESDEAYEALLKTAIEKNFNLFAEYLKNSEPIEINLSPLPLVEYLSSVVVSQQLSTKAAKTIWSRAYPIINAHRNYPNLETELRSAGLSKSKANSLPHISFKIFSILERMFIFSLKPEEL